MTRIVFVSCLALALAGCKRASSPEDRMREVRAALESAHCQLLETQGNVVRARCETREISVDLSNLWRRLEGVTDAAERERITRAFVTGPLVAEGSDTLPREKILPILKTRDQVNATLARLPPEIRKDHPIPARPFVGDLVVVVGEDTPGQILAIDLARMKQWNADPGELMSLALANLAARPLPPIEREAGNVLRISTGDGYDAVRILVQKVHDALSVQLGGLPVFAIPDREDLLAARADDPAAVAALRAEAQRRFASAAYPLTPDLIGKDAQDRPTLLPNR